MSQEMLLTAIVLIISFVLAEVVRRAGAMVGVDSVKKHNKPNWNDPPTKPGASHLHRTMLDRDLVGYLVAHAF